MRSPAEKLLRRSYDVVSKPLTMLSDTQIFYVGFALFCLITTLLVHNPLWRAAPEPPYKVGDIVRQTVISPADINYTDAAATERLRAEAQTAVKPIFRYESNKSEATVQGFVSTWEKLQRLRDTSEKSAGTEARSQVKWDGAGGAETARVLLSRQFSRNEIDAVQSALRESSTGYIYDDSDRQYFKNQVFVFDRSKPNLQSNVAMPESTWTALSAARDKLRTRIEAIKSLSEKEAEAFYTATSIMIEPSISYDSVATENARETAAQNIKPAAVVLKRSQKVANQGDIVTAEMLSNIAAVQNYGASTRQLGRFLGILLLVIGLFWAAWKFVQHRGVVPRLALSPRKTFALIGFIVVVQTGVVAVLFRLAEFTADQNVQPPYNDPTLWALAIPFASGSLMMTLLADRPTALFVGLLNALITGFMAPRSFEFALVAALTSAVAVYGIGRYRNRQTVTMAGALVGTACVPLALALIAYSQQPFILNTVLLAVACSLASGITTAAITSVLLPICENFFGILTDVKLLELSNADLPILGQLALRAPGTNQHSHAVGQLAEEACRVVGANGLLARIGALYHDIGKIAAPEHFVENQHGRNPHDKLKPLQSAKIIISHVTYGTKLGREMGLPQRIVDFIPQHHGTRTLHYFLRRAQDSARPDEEISESDFRYPGPKPQFKEAAIMMIADSCEAGARSLAEPTPENIRFIVTKIVDSILGDDQLGECDLTLRELTQIRESMIRSLIAIYHSRVDYPGYVPPTSGQYKLSSAEVKVVGGVQFIDPKDIPVSPGGEIEDEAIDRSVEPGLADARSAK
ncbi:MAG: HDIG domain-containing protein [Pyrinomonadaceae bacterium]|nr:HDIG domain-containing protein [Pyrinomonadaceae bacterium]